MTEYANTGVGEQQAPRAGWYPDPLTQGVERWWNGEAWTEHTRSVLIDAAPGALLLQPPTGVVNDASGVAHVQLAPPAARLAARLIDALMLGVVATLLAGQLAQPAIDEATLIYEQLQAGVAQPVYDQQAMLSSMLAFTAVSLLIRGIYYVTLIASYGTTLGKRICGVGVLDIEGRQVGWRSALVRWLCRDIWRALGAIPVLALFGLMYVGLDSLWCLRDRRGQCLHDKPARTLAVRYDAVRAVRDRQPADTMKS